MGEDGNSYMSGPSVLIIPYDLKTTNICHAIQSKDHHSSYSTNLILLKAFCFDLLGLDVLMGT